MEKALVKLGLIGISSNSWLVVPGIFTVIDWMSKLFKELTGRNGLRGLGRDGFGSNNWGCLRKWQAGSIDLLLSCHCMTCKAYKSLSSQVTQKLGDKLEGQVPGQQTCCLFLYTNREWNKGWTNEEYGLWCLRCMDSCPRSTVYFLINCR